MVYPAYLVCLALMMPAFALTAFAGAMLLVGSKGGWSSLINGLAFFGEGIVDPLRYGWRVAVLVAAVGLLVGAGIIPGVRDYAFYGLALLATVCVAFCLYAASTVDFQNVMNALIVLTPSLVGIGGCLWLGTKFKA